MAAAAIPDVSIDPPSNTTTTNVEDTHNAILEKQKAISSQVPVSQVHTPPTTDEASHKDDDAASSSSLSDLDDEIEDQENRIRFEDAARAGAEAEQFSEVKPDRYENGIPIFTPTMDQFKDFERYVKGVDPYGMQSGIVLIDPPEEWKQARKALDDMVKTIKIKNPITQEFHGTQGIYTQRNMEKMRSYNLPQWKSLCEQTENQPPARRGEKRMNADKLLGRGSIKSRKADPLPMPEGMKRKAGRPRVNPVKEETTESESAALAAPPTPTSPDTKPAGSAENEDGTEADETREATPSKPRGRKPGPKPKGRQPKSSVGKKDGNKGSETTVAARRLRNAREAAEFIDEEAFADFDYRVHDNDQWTAERCDELEEKYWKSLNFSNPMYAADMPGSLFDEETKEWNVAKLPNLLDLLGQPIPGVNTAYLYLGMWRATFAWHLEDVDLYSINYIHFGAPKQWYSISQRDAPKFEAAMKALWGSDAKDCDQFLRHKTYLVSPALLKSKYGVTVNKVVHREGQFVITFPIGYHSGYNLGYNCAESVNFAIENWLQYGKTARKCQCEADSVFIDVDWFVRKMNGEPTPEFEEIEVTDDEDDDLDEPTDLPTPPSSDRGKIKLSLKRKRATKDAGPNKKAKKIIKIRKIGKNQPCCLCPNDFSWEELLPTSHGQRAHRTCAMYTPETYIASQGGKEMVFNVENISKARLELKCYECRQKKGSCFQCSSAKCTKSYHATCAMQAGVQVDKGEIAVWHEGIEYRDVGFDWRCRLHRTFKRIRITSEVSACNHTNSCWSNAEFLEYVQNLKPGELIQWQPTHADEIEAGVVISSYDEGLNAVLVKTLPEQYDLIYDFTGINTLTNYRKKVKEIEVSWILFVDSATSCLQKPSANALDLPEELQGKTASLPESTERKPSTGDPFTEDPKTEWAEFVSAVPPHNSAQKRVDLTKDKQMWLYLGKTSTDSKAHFTSDPEKPVHDPASVFLDSVEPLKPIMAPPPAKRQSLSATFPTISPAARNSAMSTMQQQAVAPYGQTPATATMKFGQHHEAVMNVTRERMMEMQSVGQIPKPSQYRDLLAGVEARANEQARILQRQHAKAQQLDIQDRLSSVPLTNIGVDKAAVERQRQFQQYASDQAKDLNKWQNGVHIPQPNQFPNQTQNYNAMGGPSAYGNQPMSGFDEPSIRNQQIHYSNDWMNPAGGVQRTDFPNQHQSSAGPMQIGNLQDPHNLPQPLQGSHSFSPYMQPNRPDFPSNSSTTSQSQHMGYTNGYNQSRNDFVNNNIHNAGVQVPQQSSSTSADVERRRRISNPAYPFKTPDQIQARKDAEKASPGSRPNTGYMAASPNMKEEGFMHMNTSKTPVLQSIDPMNPPQFINPNATQISPPGSSGGPISSRPGSISGPAPQIQMGPPPPGPVFKRTSSNDNHCTRYSSSAASPMGPASNYVPRRSMYDPVLAVHNQIPQPPHQVQFSLISQPSDRLLATVQSRPTTRAGLPTNDKPVPQVFTEWQGKGGFWGKVAGYYVMRHETAASAYKSPFASPSAATTKPMLSIADRYYESLRDEDKKKIDDYRKGLIGSG